MFGRSDASLSEKSSRCRTSCGFAAVMCASSQVSASLAAAIKPLSEWRFRAYIGLATIHRNHQNLSTDMGSRVYDQMNTDECNQRAAACAANAELATDAEVSLEYLRLAARWRSIAVRGIFVGDLGLPVDEPPVSGTIAGLLKG